MASFYLPVTLTKRTVEVNAFSDMGGGGINGAADATSTTGEDAQASDDVWVAEWDYEPLVALQVGGACTPRFRSYDINVFIFSACTGAV